MSLDGTRRLKEMRTSRATLCGVNFSWINSGATSFSAMRLTMPKTLYESAVWQGVPSVSKLCIRHHRNVEQRSFNRRRTAANNGGIGGRKRTVGVTSHDG